MPIKQTQLYKLQEHVYKQTLDVHFFERASWKKTTHMHRKQLISATTNMKDSDINITVNLNLKEDVCLYVIASLILPALIHPHPPPPPYPTSCHTGTRKEKK